MARAQRRLRPLQAAVRAEAAALAAELQLGRLLEWQLSSRLDSLRRRTRIVRAGYSHLRWYRRFRER